MKESDLRPTRDLFSDEVLATEFEYRKAVPFRDRSLALALPCRKRWKWVEVSSREKSSVRRLIPLARVDHPEDPEVRIEMAYILLPREVRLEDWVDLFFAAHEMEVLDGAVENYYGRRVVDAVVRFRDGDATRLGRMGFFKDGPRVYLIAGSSPEVTYRAHAREFAVSVQGGAPQKLLGQPYAEDTRDVVTGGLPRFRFLIPESWDVEFPREVPSGVEAIEIFRGQERNLSGLIKVRIYSRFEIPEMDREKAVWSVFEEIREGASKVGGLAGLERIHDMPANSEHFSEGGRMQTYRGKLGKLPVEFHLVVLQGPDTVFLACLVTPERTKSRYEWMVDRRAWEILGSTLEKRD